MRNFHDRALILRSFVLLQRCRPERWRDLGCRRVGSRSGDGKNVGEEEEEETLGRGHHGCRSRDLRQDLRCQTRQWTPKN